MRVVPGASSDEVTGWPNVVAVTRCVLRKLIDRRLSRQRRVFPSSIEMCVTRRTTWSRGRRWRNLNQTLSSVEFSSKVNGFFDHMSEIEDQYEIWHREIAHACEMGFSSCSAGHSRFLIRKKKLAMCRRTIRNMSWVKDCLFRNARHSGRPNVSPLRLPTALDSARARARRNEYLGIMLKAGIAF